MNNLVNMSEYQKVIFVKGIDESNNISNGIGNLSSEYPFVVFMTDKTEAGLPYSVKNLWFDGTRLTRFIGIDKAHDSIFVGDHVLHLKFDYDSGLLGIYDVNDLYSLKIISVSYKDVITNQQNTYQYPTSTDILKINAVDNMFKVVFEYVVEDDNNADVSSISKALTFDSDEFSKTTERNVSLIDHLTQQYEFTYNIVKATGQNLSNISYGRNVVFTSEYSQDISCECSFNLCLNPLSYIIRIRKTGESSENIITDAVNLDKNTAYTIDLQFNPINVTSSPKHQLWANISIGDTSYITLATGQSSRQEISNGHAYFNIKVSNDIPVNQIISTLLRFDIEYKFNWSTSEINAGNYNNLSKQINVFIEGEVTNRYFYFGYTDPRTDASLLKPCNDPETHIWKGEEIEDGHEDSWYTNKYFYCAIPSEYTSIKPRWDAYTDETQSIDNATNLLTCEEWFDMVGNNVKINNISFIIYKKKKSGKFYGRIK